MADNSYLSKANKISSSVRDMSNARIATRSAKADKLTGGAWANYSNKAARLIGPGQRTASSNPLSSSSSYGDALSGPTKPLNEKADYSEWGAVGWAFRMFTGLGRAILNTTANTISAVADANKALSDGLQSDDWGALGGAFWKGMWAAPIGTFEGLAYSAVPDAKNEIAKLTGGKTYDRFDQLINSEEWLGAGIPKVSEDVYLDTPFGGWTAKNTLGFILDAGLDPTTYLTVGAGAAIKGAGRGVATAARYVTAADKAAAAGKVINKPRPFYAPLEKVDGKFLRTRAGNKIELSAPKYTIENTNPYVYILKEMGRGFQEAHQAAFDRWASKSAARAYARNLDETLAKAGTDLPDEEVLRLGSDMLEQQLSLKKAALEADKKISKEQADQFLAEEAARLGRTLSNVVARRKTMVKQSAETLKNAAEAAGTKSAPLSATRAADEATMALEGPSRIFAVTKGRAQLAAAAPIQKLSDDIISAVRRQDGDGGYSAWDAFVADPANADYLRYLDEATSQPIGFRQVKSGNGRVTLEDAPVQGAPTKRKGGGTVGRKNEVREVKFLQRKQSDFQKKNKAMVWNADNTANDWLRLRSVMSRSTDGNLALPASEITGDLLKKSGISMSLFASRLEWAARRLAGEGNDAAAIENAIERGYNPLTAQPYAARSFDMWSGEEDKAIAKALGRNTLKLSRGDIYGLLQQAAGVIRDKELRALLRRLGLRSESLSAIEGRVALDNIAEDLTAARMSQIVAAKKAIAKAIEKKTIKINIKGKPVTLTAAMVTKLTDNQVIDALDAGLRRNKLRSELVSQAELDLAIESVEKLAQAKLQAIMQLSRHGINVVGDTSNGSALLTAVTGTYNRKLGPVLRKGLDRIFTETKVGEAAKLKSEFLAYAWAASSHTRDSLDGGVFAEALDALAAKAGIPPLASFKTAESRAEALKLLAQTDEWTAYVTPPLLHSLEVRTRTIGKATGSSRAAVVIKNEEKRLTKKVEELLKYLEDDIYESKIALGKEYSRNKIILPYPRGKEADTSYLSIIIDEGRAVTGKDLVSEEFPEGIAAADRALKTNYISATKEVIDMFKNLPANPGMVPAVIKNGVAVAAAEGEKATHLIVDAVINSAKKKKYNALSKTERFFYDRLIAARYERAQNAAIEAIARKEAIRSIPLSLDKKALLSFIQREIKANSTSVARVEANINARFWHAYDMRIAETAADLRAIETPLHKFVVKSDGGVLDLVKEQKSFDRLVKKIEAAVEKDYPNLAKVEWDGEMSVLKVIETGNPNLFISWLRNKEILTVLDQDEWEIALRHMKNMTKLGGGGSRWRNYRELLDSYVDRKNSTLLPGQINPATGRPVPTEEQVATVLEALGVKDADKMLSKAEILKRSDILGLIRSAKKHISEEELKQAQMNDMFSNELFAAGDDIKAMSDALPAPEITVDQTLHMLTSAVNTLEEAGESWVVDIADLSAGRAFGTFTDMPGYIAKEEGTAVRPVANLVYEDFAGRMQRANVDKETAKTLPKKDQVFIKPNFDTYNLYTAWKEIIFQLENIAEGRKLAKNSPAWREFMTVYTKKVLQVRDLYFNARGIYPSSTINLSKGELANLAKITGKFGDEGLTKAEIEKLGKHAVYLTETDFMDVFGPVMSKEFFFTGRLDSLPITSMLPAARLLIIGMSALKEGMWFEADIISRLKGEMIDAMENAIRKIDRGKTEKGIKIKSLMNDEATLFNTRVKIETLVDHLLREDVADQLYRNHVARGGYAYKRLQYEAGVVTEPIFKGLFQLLDSKFTSDGMNIKAVEDAGRALNEAAGIVTNDPRVELIAKMDFGARIGARLQPHQAIIIKEIQKVEDLSAEAKSIQELQQGASEALDPILFQNMMFTNTMELINKNADDDLIYEFAVNLHAEKGTILKNLRMLGFLDRGLRMFASYGMDEVRHLADPIVMNTKTVTSEFAETVAKHAYAMKEKFGSFEERTGRNLSAEAFAAFQKMPDEVAQKAFDAMKRLEEIADAKASGLIEGMTKEEYSNLLDDVKLLDDYIPAEDSWLRDAAADLWILHSRMLAGAEKNFLTQATAYETRLFNKFLRDIGQGMGREITEIVDTKSGKAITNRKDAEIALKAGTATVQPKKVRDSYALQSIKDPEGFANQWREWEISNPLDLYVGLHTAGRKTLEVRIMGAELEKFGFPVESISKEEARAADLVEIVPPKNIPHGAEMLHYLPKGYYFPRALASEIQSLAKFMGDVKHLEANGTLEKALLKMQWIQDIAKKSMTNYTPKNWIQNTLGGVVANSLFLGVNSPLAYARGAEVMRSVGQAVDELGLDRKSIEGMLAKLDRRTAKGQIEFNPANDPLTSTSYTTKVQNKSVNIPVKTWWDMYTKYAGVVPHSQAGGVDALREAGMLGKVKKPNLYQRGDAFLARNAGTRDDWLRIVAFINIIQKGNWNSLEEAAAYAGKQVNRVHPQVQGLSTVNQKWTRNFVLFFTWRAKMLGTVLMDVLDKPGVANNILRFQQTMGEAQGAEYSGFGDFDPNNQLRPWYMRGNMSPTILNDQGRMASFTVSNPITDLLGQGSWLQGLRFNNQDPIEQQIGQVGYQTFDNFVTSSNPLLISLYTDWVDKKETQGGSPLLQNGRFTNKTVGLLVEDALSKIGWGPQHIMAAMLFPDIAKKASEDGMNKDALNRKHWIAINNWLSGMKLTELDTIEIRKKAVQEIIARRKDQAGL